nr:immunoglobulin light chain junction region [Macaca mulatta]
CQQYTSTPFTF